MESIKVALLGLGTVGQGVYETIQTHQEKLFEVTGKSVEVVGVLVKDAQKNRMIDPNVIVTTNVEELLAIEKLDVVFEAIVGIEPANTYIRRFIEKGCHIVSANKELLAHKGKELTQLAYDNRCFLTFEAAVAGGIPVLRTILQLLQVNGITKLEGILNGTSNYILTNMRKQKTDFHDVLKEAQSLGYAEADPSNDIHGTDAFYKLMILSDLIFEKQPSWENVKKIGIQHVAQNDLSVGEELGLRLKLIASLQKEVNGINAYVRPVFVHEDHPLYNVEGVNNGIVVETDLVGTLLLQGPGAGAKATASAMIEDFVYIKERKEPKWHSGRNSESYKKDDKSQTIWLLISKEKNHLLQSNASYFETYQLTCLKQVKVLGEANYIVGDLVTGDEKDVINLLKTVGDEQINYYPVFAPSSVVASRNVNEPVSETIR